MSSIGKLFYVAILVLVLIGLLLFRIGSAAGPITAARDGRVRVKSMDSAANPSGVTYETPHHISFSNPLIQLAGLGFDPQNRPALGWVESSGSGGGTITQSTYRLETDIGQIGPRENLFAASYGISNSFWSSLFFPSSTQGLTLTKTAPATVYFYQNSTAEDQDVFSYTIVATNNDTSAATLTIEDTLPTGVDHVSTSITPNGNCTGPDLSDAPENDDVITCNGILLGANQSATITIIVRATAAVSNTNISNSAKIVSVSPNIEATANTFVARTWKVTTTAGTVDGVCDANCSLRDAINAANGLSGVDTIEVPAGTYTLTTVDNTDPYENSPNGLPQIAGRTVIQGAGADSTKIERSSVPGTPDFRIFYVNDLGSFEPNLPRLTLNGLTVKNGKIPGGHFGMSYGGAIQPVGGRIEINNCRFENNTAARNGGAIIAGSPDTSINNSTFTGNIADQNGGAIFAQDGVTITNSTFVNNIAATGGGAIALGHNSTVTISDSTFTNNTVTGDGAGGAINGYNINVSNSILIGNSAPFNSSNTNGGAISGNTVAISNSTISGGTAGAGGGGVFGTNVTVTDSTISENVAGNHGGGINANNLTINNSTISGNFAKQHGGGILFGGSASTLNLNNTTITNNTADSDGNGTGRGGGMLHSWSFSQSQMMFIRNTIIAGNINSVAPDCADEFGGTTFSQGYNLIGNNTGCNFSATTGDQVGTSSTPINPLLGALQNNGGAAKTHALLANSPAIDTANPATPDGTGSSCLPTDQRGAPRPGDATATQRCDIGAYELVNHVATGLAFTVQPSNAAAGETITPAIQVQIQDQFGLPISSSGAVTILIGNNPGGSTMSGTLTRNAVNGVATFDDLSLNRSGAGYTLQATFGPAFVTSNAFDISPGAPHQLNFTFHPTNANVQEILSPAVQVMVQDQFGNLITDATNAITIALGNNPSNATLSGALTRDAGNGVATFNDLRVSKLGNGYTLVASAASLQSATTQSFDVLGPHHLAFVVQPSNTAVNGVITPTIKVEVRDQFDELFAEATDAVTIAIHFNPSGNGILSGTVTRNAVSGKITFDDLRIDRIGNGYLLRVTASGLTQAISDPFNITGGAPYQVAFTAQPTNTNTGQVITPAVQATVQDEWGNNLTSATNEITIALGNNPGGATLNGTVTRTAINGVATFDDLSLSHGGNGYFLLASSNGLISSGSNTFNVIDPAVINIIEQILVNDAPAMLPSAMISVTENIAVQDAPALLPAAMISVTENIAVQDAPALLPAAMLNIIEQINVLDTPAFWPPVATPSGGSVSVQVGNVTITFHNVSTAGFTSVVPIDPESAGTLPAGFTLCAGCPAYEITTTAVYAPPVTIAMNLPSVNDQVVFSQLRMLHGEDGVLVDRTTGRDLNDKQVFGSVNSLSPFVIAQNASIQTPTPTPTPTPSPTVNAGQVIISEFRLRGAGNNGVATGLSQKPLLSKASSIAAESTSPANDEFVEIYNATDSDITVSTTDETAGWALAASDGTARFVIPNGTVIPARGHFLGVNSGGYSLSAFAAADIEYTTDIPDNAGIALFRTANPANFTLDDRLDAVGSTLEANALYREGAGYPPFTPADLALNLEHSFYRSLCSFQWGVGCATPGYPRDTNENAVDFLFVDTNGALTAAGQRLGAPGPENLASPIRRDAAMPFVLVDASVQASAPPNRLRDSTSDPANASTFGTLAVPRRITNNTGGPVTRLQFRIVELTTWPAPNGMADLRARTTSASFTVSGINDANTCAATGTPITTPCMVTVQPTTLTQPPNPLGYVGGGQNAILAVGTITTSEPLQDGQSINVQFLLGVQRTGLFRFLIIIEALP